MTNMKKLKAKIIENGLTVENVAQAMGINHSTLYRRLSDNGETFTIAEAHKLGKILNLNIEEINGIFFTNNVADMR